MNTSGTSRSDVIRRAVRAWLADGVEARIDEAIAAGYRRIRAPAPDTFVHASAVASIEEEPW